MQDVTGRFITIYEQLRATKKIQNASEFCKVIGISTSMMTEIKKGRSQVGVIALQNTVTEFPEVDARWLLTGKIEKNRDLPDDKNLLEQIELLKNALKDKERIIRLLESENITLRKPDKSIKPTKPTAKL